tara:strand:- start:1042 stop:2373 length:1332 start_codon:yes stop_codon:yes gene_type:complete
MLSILNKSKIKFNSIEYGQYCFYIGTLLLASTNLFAGIFYLISLVISLSKKSIPLKKDNWNLTLFICTIIMLISSTYISIIQNNSTIYSVLKANSWQASALWLSLFNWIPLFLSFYGFQKYLKTEIQRIRFAKCLFLGVIPVLVTIILQKWFNVYGPFRYLNGLLVFYLKDVALVNSGSAGLFSNPNYAGLWLSATLPFCFQILETYKSNKFKFGFIFTILISTLYCILLTNSRNSFLGIIISMSIMLSGKFLFFLLILGLLFVLFSQWIIPSFLGITDLDLLPKTTFKKLLLTNYFDKVQFRRIDIWSKSFNFILKKPLLGWGASTFPILYLINGGLERAQHTHNMLLELAHNNGIPLAIILTGFVTLLFFKAWKIIFIKNKNSVSIINKAWITSFLIIMISHISDITYYDGRVSLLIWILMAGLKTILDEDKLKHKLKKLS